MKKTVCIVNAHPDDLIGSAGLAFMLAESNRYELKIIDFSRGERGLTQYGVSMEECAARRTGEEFEACAMLGVQPVFLHETDGEIYAPQSTCRKLAEIFRESRPYAVFTHWPVDRHTDHVMCGAATFAALRLSGIKPEVFFHHHPHQTVNMPFLHYACFGQHIMDLKYELVRKYVCQNGAGMAEQKLCEAKFFGWKAGRTPYAEAYGSFRTAGEKSVFFEELPVNGD